MPSFNQIFCLCWAAESVSEPVHPCHCLNFDASVVRISTDEIEEGEEFVKWIVFLGQVVSLARFTFSTLNRILSYPWQAKASSQPDYILYCIVDASVQLRVCTTDFEG